MLSRVFSICPWSCARIALGLLAALCSCCPTLAAPPVSAWVTTADLRFRQSPADASLFLPADAPGTTFVKIDPARTFQSILGLGSSLDHATCHNLSQLSPNDLDQALTQLFDPQQGIGMNLMRLCIGTPDFTGEPWYTYNDLPAGETDPEMRKFSIEKDQRYILPILQKVHARFPQVLFFASPWSPPGWMKTTGSTTGGQLRQEWEKAYALYFVRFIQAYAAAGIPLHAVTIQNEPGVDRALSKDPKWFYPSCRWNADQERRFIRDHLGPALRQAGLRTEIWCYDHNFNEQPTREDAGISQPRTILSDPAAAAFVQGVAFHGYAGNPSGMSILQKEFPQTRIHFTEGSVFKLEGAALLVDYLRHEATSYNAWVTVLDENRKPNNGPFAASETVLTLDSKSRTVRANRDFHLYGQFMKYIQRGAQRLDSQPSSHNLAQVAFRNPDGSSVLVLAHPADGEAPVRVESGGTKFALRLPAQSVVTCRWQD